MTLEIASIVLTGAGVVFGVLLGVWRIQAHYELRNDAAHAELTRKIENALSNVRGEITKVTLDLQNQMGVALLRRPPGGFRRAAWQELLDPSKAG